METRTQLAREELRMLNNRLTKVVESDELKVQQVEVDTTFSGFREFSTTYIINGKKYQVTSREYI